MKAITTITGGLVEVPTLQVTSAGKHFTKFTVASSNGKLKDEKGEYIMDPETGYPKDRPADYYQITLWGNSAVALVKHAYKGFKLSCQARISSHTYVAQFITDAETGEVYEVPHKRSTYQFDTSYVEFLSPIRKTTEDKETPKSMPSAKRPPVKPALEDTMPNDEVVIIGDEELDDLPI